MRVQHAAFLALAVLVALFGTPHASSAQQPAPAAAPRGFVAGSLFASIERFSADRFDLLNGETAGGGLSIGAHLAPRWSLQLDLDLPKSIEHQPRTTATALPIGFPTFNLTEQVQHRAVVASLLLGFHPQTRGRVRLGYVGGLGLMYLRRVAQFDQVILISAAQLTPQVQKRTEAQTDFVSGAVVGIEAEIALTDRVSLVPQMRAYAFDVQTMGSLIVRPGFAMRFEF
jgi:hypothetical protein